MKRMTIEQTHIVQEIQFKMLCEVKRICDLYQIPYFLCCGTLLGCIRHQGPIPWDDDLDIGFLRKDYNKFINIAEKVMDGSLKLQTWYTDNHYALPHAKIRYINSHYIETTCKNSGCIDGISVDILAFDSVPNCKLQRYIHGYYLTHLLNVIKAKRNWNFIHQDKVNHFSKVVYRFLKQIFSDEYLIRKYEKICQRYNKNADCQDVSEATGLDFFRFINKKIFYQELVEGYFIDQNFKIPLEYKKILKKSYGDYMNYPVIEEQCGQAGVEQVVVGNQKIFSIDMEGNEENV